MDFFYQITSYDNPNFPIVALGLHDLEFSPHWHSDGEFLFVRSGSLGVTVNGSYKTIGPGTFVACGSLDIHSYRRVSARTELIIVLFKPVMVRNQTAWPASGRLLSNIVQKGEHMGFSQKAERAMVSLLDELTAKRPGFESVAQGTLLELCGLTERELSVGTMDQESQNSLSDTLKRIQAAIDYIREKSRYPITLEDVAKVASFSPWYFSRTFKKLVGMSFLSYVNEVRIELAESLMASTTKTFADIALECGFETLRTFNRVYRSIRGTTPSKVRSGQSGGKHHGV